MEFGLNERRAREGRPFPVFSFFGKNEKTVEFDREEERVGDIGGEEHEGGEEASRGEGEGESVGGGGEEGEGEGGEGEGEEGEGEEGEGEEGEGEEGEEGRQAEAP